MCNTNITKYDCCTTHIIIVIWKKRTEKKIRHITHVYKTYTLHTHTGKVLVVYRWTHLFPSCVLCMMLVLQHCCSTIAHAENKYFNQNDKKFAMEKLFSPYIPLPGSGITVRVYNSQLPVSCRWKTKQRMPYRNTFQTTTLRIVGRYYYICRRVCVYFLHIVRWRMCYEISIKSK